MVWQIFYYLDKLGTVKTLVVASGVEVFRSLFSLRRTLYASMTVVVPSSIVEVLGMFDVAVTVLFLLGISLYRWWALCAFLKDGKKRWISTFSEQNNYWGTCLYYYLLCQFKKFWFETRVLLNGGWETYVWPAGYIEKWTIFAICQSVAPPVFKPYISALSL